MTAKHLDSSHCTEDDDPILELSETREGLSEPALRFRDRFPRSRPGPTSPGTRANDEETHPFDDSPCPFDETIHPFNEIKHPFDETTHLLDDSQTQEVHPFDNDSRIPSQETHPFDESIQRFSSRRIVYSMARVNVGGQKLGHQTPR